MPVLVKVTMYRCKYKCGQRGSRSKQYIFNHESRCWRNPAVRACLTCRHTKMEVEDDGIPWERGGPHVWNVRRCYHPNEEVQDGYDAYQRLVDSFWLPVCHCVHWQSAGLRIQGE